MAKIKRLRSIRVYTVVPEEKGMETDRSVSVFKAIVGSGWFTIGARRSEFHDSKLLHVRSRRHYNYSNLLYNGAGFSLIPLFFFVDMNELKNNIVFAMVFLFLAHKLWKIAYPWLAKYWNQR